MLIKNSPFHPLNSGKKTEAQKEIQILSEIKDKPEKNVFSFLKWIKGALNPLQNLPIVSGIYSSLNSENKDSDRDMIQNSLGGFVYGGPIGALAGFGNWVFNKIFDKTPTELVLDASGVSKLWEKEDQKKEIKGVRVAKIIEKEEESLRSENSEAKSKKSVEGTFIINQKLKNLNIVDERKINTIEFNYPKWKPEESIEILSKKKSLDLSSLKKMYNNNLTSKEFILNVRA